MFIPLDDKLLNSKLPLTREELDLIDKSITLSGQVIAICTNNDRDVLNYHYRYLSQCIERLEYSLKPKTGTVIALPNNRRKFTCIK